MMRMAPKEKADDSSADVDVVDGVDVVAKSMDVGPSPGSTCATPPWKIRGDGEGEGAL